MTVALRFTPLGQSPSSNGFGPIIGADDIPTIEAPIDGPIDIRLTHFRFADRFGSGGNDFEYDDNGNLLAVDGSKWLNQQVAKLIQSTPDPNGPHPSYGTPLAGVVGQKNTSGSFSKELVAGAVREAVVRHALELLAQPGITNDQVIKDVEDVFVGTTPNQDELEVIVFLRTRSGIVSPVGSVLSV